MISLILEALTAFVALAFALIIIWFLIKLFRGKF